MVLISKSKLYEFNTLPRDFDSLKQFIESDYLTKPS